VNTADTGRFNEAVDHYKQALAVRDSQALKARVLPEFQRIAQGGGPEAAEAGRYIAVLIPAAIRDTTPWPAIACPAVPRGMGPTIKVGDLVACGLLDPPKIHWTQFSWPDFPEAASRAGQQKGIAMLSVTVDQGGNVIEVKPRGPTDSYGFADAASSAARRWKTNPPATQGKPVRTAFSVDIPFSQ
jgi:TonB family protein